MCTYVLNIFAIDMVESQKVIFFSKGWVSIDDDEVDVRLKSLWKIQFVTK